MAALTNGRAPGLPQLEGGIRIARHKHLLDGELLGTILADQGRQALENDPKPFRHGLLTHSDTAAVEVFDQPPLGAYDPVPGNTGTGINPENDRHGQPPAIQRESMISAEISAL